MVKAKPDGYNDVTPYLIVDNAARAIDYYTDAFGAKEVVRMPGADGKISHAEIQIGDSRIMLGDETAEGPWRSAKSIGATPVSIMLYVDDVDATFQKAVAAGATELQPVQNHFYGDRMGWLADPFGHVWSIGTHVEDVSEEEMGRRMQQMVASGEWGQS